MRDLFLEQLQGMGQATFAKIVTDISVFFDKLYFGFYMMANGWFETPSMRYRKEAHQECRRPGVLRRVPRQECRIVARLEGKRMPHQEGRGGPRLANIADLNGQNTMTPELEAYTEALVEVECAWWADVP